MNKFVLAGIGILSTLLIILLIIFSFNKKATDQQNTVSPTTIPNDFRTSTRNQVGVQSTPQPEPTVAPEVQKQLLDQYAKQYVQDVSKLSQRQKDAIAKIAPSLPLITPDFELAYSPLTNEFFLRKITAQADQKFQEYLKTNNLTDLYTDHPDFFIQTTENATKTLQIYENRYASSIEAIKPPTTSTQTVIQSPSTATQQLPSTITPTSSLSQDPSSQIKPLVNILQSLLSFNIHPHDTTSATNQTGQSTNTTSNAVSVNTAPQGSLPNGSVGIEDTVVVQGIRVNKLIAAQIDALLTAAHNAGLKLSGGGYRSYEDQVDTRKANCGTSYYNVYQEPSSQCKPPTAIPGHSMHERGLAIDFTCNGNLVSNSDLCHAWLVTNANSFGLIGNSVEPWHWSTNGN